MKRTLITIFVFLLLGAIVNVAVAWGLAAWAPQTVFEGDKVLESLPPWPTYLSENGWPSPKTGSAHASVGSEFGTTVITFWNYRSDNGLIYETRRFGLPFRSLQWARSGFLFRPRDERMAQEIWMADGWRWGINISDPLGSLDGRDMNTVHGWPTPMGSLETYKRRSLPLMPVWSGFILNTAFYAALLWMMVKVPGMERRAIRRSRGLCPKCAYPIGESPVCTECGNPLPRRANQPVQ